MEASHVLRAMGVAPRYVQGALRLSLGHTTKELDVRTAITAITQSVKRLRNQQ
jgi:cysteine desulfurase